MIEGVTGLMGMGKTYYTTWRALKAINAGIEVYANYSIAGMSGYWQEWPELIRATLPEVDSSGRIVRDPATGRTREKLVIIDEANITCPSRGFAKLPVGVLQYWAMSRKLGLTILWTAQDADRIDKALREVTYQVWESAKVGRFFWYHAYKISDLGKAKRSSIGSKILWRRGSVERSYDTLELIRLPEHLTDEDWCGLPTIRDPSSTVVVPQPGVRVEVKGKRRRSRVEIAS